MRLVLWIQQRLKSWLIRLVVHTMAKHTAQLEYGQDRPVPATLDAGFILKQSLTKKSRTALAREMVAMCSLYGWQATTLNRGMSDSDKMAILTTKFSKVALTDDPGTLYDELVGLAAATMGWAQAISKAQRKAAKQK